MTLGWLQWLMSEISFCRKIMCQDASSFIDHCTWSSSMEDPHLSKSILLIATFSLLEMHRATWTTAVAPLPINNMHQISKVECFSTEPAISICGGYVISSLGEGGGEGCSIRSHFNCYHCVMNQVITNITALARLASECWLFQNLVPKWNSTLAYYMTTGVWRHNIYQPKI